MAVAEPVDSELWNEIKKTVPWPDADEDAVSSDIATAWQTSSAGLETTISRLAAAGEEAFQSWQDQAGADFAGKAIDVSELQKALAKIQQVAASTENFSQIVRSAKQAIVSLVESNELLHKLVSLLPPEYQEAAKKMFEQLVTQAVQGIVQAATGQISAEGSAGSESATSTDGSGTSTGSSPGGGAASGAGTEPAQDAAVPDTGAAQNTPPDTDQATDEQTQKILDGARAEIGYQETGNDVNKFGPEGQPWCSYFATKMWQNAGVDIPNYGFTGDVYNWGEANGKAYTDLSQAKPGDVLLFGTGPGSPETSTHIGIVEAVDGDTVTLIEGNSSDAVQRVSHSLSGGEFYGGVHP